MKQRLVIELSSMAGGMRVAPEGQARPATTGNPRTRSPASNRCWMILRLVEEAFGARLCRIVGVARSSFYHWLSAAQQRLCIDKAALPERNHSPMM
ncbi:hypothetical protein ABZ815_02780 [Nonomuraea sp. NPDC047529]|uniref:hypothetical protein n=1 Tax=Nonomuraea sp. NPDC047529 TaxID=3155623 RepID=UPI0033E16E4B